MGLLADIVILIILGMLDSRKKGSRKSMEELNKEMYYDLIYNDTQQYNSNGKKI